MKPVSRLLPSILLLSLTVFAFGQTKPRPFALTVDNIMRGTDLIGYAPRAVHFSQDGKRVYFEWKKAGDPESKEYAHYAVNADGSGLRLLTEAEAKLAPPVGGDLSPDKRYTVTLEEEGLVLYDHVGGKRRLVISTTEAMSNPHFTRDGKEIVFVRQNNLYALSLEGVSLRQLTDIRMGATPDAQAAPDRRAGRGNPPRTDRQAGQDGQTAQAGTSQDALKKTESELFETIRDHIKERDEQEAKRKKEAAERRKPYTLAAGQIPFGMQLSPDGLYVSLTVREGGQGGKSTIIPRFITESGYTEEMPGRAKVGDVQGRSQIVVLSVETGEAHRVEFAPPPITAVGVKERVRQISWFNWQWSEDGKRAAVMARAADNKDVWVLGVDPTTGKTTILAQNHDDAWVGGPGAFTLGFLPDGRHVYYISERDGYAHLYVVGTDGGQPVQLTQGKYEVSQVRLSEDKKRFYFMSSEEGPAERGLFSMPIAGGTHTRITRLSEADEDGYTVSPDDQTLAVIRSESNRPPELFLMPNRPAADAVQVTRSPTAEWLSYRWLAPPIVSIPARDKTTISARIYVPAKWRRGGPAILFVHGAGYLQNVHNWWSHYYREYMFHHLLMEHGYLVLDADYRGSAGYGRDWRTGIYRHMGGKDLDDEVDAARWLTKKYGVNPKRIGIYGGSYGGFLTLMAMFTAPDVFAAGAALRPVTDWAHYNHGYTSDILNEPQSDPEAYRLSSPIFFAEGLKGALLICHGMVDDNVHFQDSVRLTQRLIELRKENWELAPYPVESHGFTEPSSWADEYKRILKLFDANLINLRH